MQTLADIEVSIDLVRPDRQTQSLLSIMVKMVQTIWTAAFVAGTTGDMWLAAMVLVGYPAAWSVAWIISRQVPRVES